MSLTEVANLSLVAAADAIREGSLTSVDLLRANLAQIDARNGSLNAVVALDREAAFAAARAADAVRGTGLLHGVPLAHKDMYYQAGRRSTCGSALRADFAPTYTATVIERLAAAGSFAFASLNMAEFAMNGTGHNAFLGGCGNAWNPDYVAGGSSSGSGAAVAARMTAASLGSDTGGSIRIPASANGVTGLKPTHARVSRHGVMPLSTNLDVLGPLARDARDCARMLSVIAGEDPRDPTSAALPVPDYEMALTGDLRGLRVGLPETTLAAHLSPAVSAAYTVALEVLKLRGATIVPVDLPHLDEISAYGALITRTEAAAMQAQAMRERPQDFSPHISARLYSNLALPGSYYVEALNRRGTILRSFARQVFARVDVIAMPVLKDDLPTREETEIDGGQVERRHRQMGVSDNTRQCNYLGLPCISLPIGFDGKGLPIGMQIAGRPFAEATVLRAADAHQRETDWHLRRPSLRAAVPEPAL